MTSDLRLPRFLPYCQPDIQNDDIQSVLQVLTTPMITRGPQVQSLEEDICTQTGASYAVAFCNASAALIASLSSLKCNEFDELITTANTFAASASCGLHHSMALKLVDIDTQTGNLNLDNLQKALQSPKSRGKRIIIPVHYAGIPLDMYTLYKMITSLDTNIVEDAAHALGSHYPCGTPVGSCKYSDMTVFSLHAVKNIAAGEGGVVTTNRQELYEKLLEVRNSGIKAPCQLPTFQKEPWRYDLTRLSSNYHMTEMQAALARSQLRRIDAIRKWRETIINRYLENFKNAPIRLISSSSHSCYHLAVTQIDYKELNIDKTHFFSLLREQNVGTQVHYVPLYRHSLFQNALKQKEHELIAQFPQTEQFYANALSIPLFNSLQLGDVDTISRIVIKTLEKIKK